MTWYNQKERKTGGNSSRLASLGIFHSFTVEASSFMAPPVSLGDQLTVLNVNSSSGDVTVAWRIAVASFVNGQGFSPVRFSGNNPFVHSPHFTMYISKFGLAWSLSLKVSPTADGDLVRIGNVSGRAEANGESQGGGG
ncbi:unnamed protein product [Lactuca saligna]|uniref:Uncharacterized protein n=1 Tax=Lactuca saligna TaxID=75948 RepID=A0AA35USM0_LACSI|nr:unnamed protein product [Lactuca saligna]